MPFVKGQSGNPNGRPKKLLADGRSLSDVAKEHTELAIQVLVEVAQTGESDSARVTAATAILDRGWGRPSQLLGSDPEHPLPEPMDVTAIAQHFAASLGVSEDVALKALASAPVS